MIVSQRRLLHCLALPTLTVVLYLAAGSGCSKPEPKPPISLGPKVPATADESVRNVLAGLQRHELQALWEFLPLSFRFDVQELTRRFALRLDKRSWGPFVTTCQKARHVVAQLVRNGDEAGDGVPESDRQLLARLRDVEQLLQAVCESDLNDVSRFRRLDVSSFLSQIGNAFLAAAARGVLDGAGLEGDPFSTLGEVTVELLESAGGTAVLNVKWPGQEPTQHKFVRVEEGWIPQTLAEAWPTEFPKVREQCLVWADELRANPEPWHARLREIDQLLDELAVTKSLAETRQVWQAGASRFVVAWFGMTIPEPPKTEEIPVESPVPAKPVRVKKPDTEVLLPDEPQK